MHLHVLSWSETVMLEMRHAGTEHREDGSAPSSPPALLSIKSLQK